MAVKRKADETKRAGQATLGLAEKDKVRLEPRLPAGILAGLSADVPVLDDSADAQKTARVGKRAATLSQEEVSTRLARKLQDLRDAGRIAGLPREVLVAMGVGKALCPGVVRTVTSGADAMIAAYAEHTTALRAAGRNRSCDSALRPVPRSPACCQSTSRRSRSCGRCCCRQTNCRRTAN